MVNGCEAGRRRAAEGRGVASPRPPTEECTMNRAPTLVRPAANERRRPAKDGKPYQMQRQLGQHVVLSLPAIQRATGSDTFRIPNEIRPHCAGDSDAHTADIGHIHGLRMNRGVP